MSTSIRPCIQGLLSPVFFCYSYACCCVHLITGLWCYGVVLIWCCVHFQVKELKTWSATSEVKEEGVLFTALYGAGVLQHLLFMMLEHHMMRGAVYSMCMELGYLWYPMHIIISSLHF